MKTWTTQLAKLTCLFSTFFLCSCLDNFLGKTPAIVESTGKKICVVPFSVVKEGSKKHYFQSKVGLRMAQVISGHIKSSSENVTTFNAFQLKEDVNSSLLAEPRWDKFCKKHDLDYIVVGDIIERRYVNPKNRTMYQGYSKIRIKVINKENNVLFHDTLEYYFPKLNSSDPFFKNDGIPVSEIRPEEILQSLDYKTNLEISRIFYSYKKEG